MAGEPEAIGGGSETEVAMTAAVVGSTWRATASDLLRPTTTKIYDQQFVSGFYFGNRFDCDFSILPKKIILWLPLSFCIFKLF